MIKKLQTLNESVTMKESCSSMNVPTFCPLFWSQFHTMTFPFQQPAASRRPSGLKATQFRGLLLLKEATSLHLDDHT